MSPSPDHELLTQSAARQLLERAGQIDSDSTSVDTLRVAAREAGISEAAFEAALIEMRGRIARQPEPAQPRWRKRIAVTIAAAAMFFAAALVVIPNRAGPPQPGMLHQEVLVQCLPMTSAQDIALRLLTDPGSEVSVSRGSRVLRMRGTQTQLDRLQAEIAQAAKAQTTCDNAPAGR